jgi:hypothetical protein
MIQLNFNPVNKKIMAKNIVLGYFDESYPPLPTKSIIFWRRNLIWQACRFIVLNLKMMRIIVGGHSYENDYFYSNRRILS